MVGRLVDATGAPLSDVVIQTVEAQARTGGDGQFAVSWREPTQVIHFERGDVFWQRAYQPEDASRQVLIQLPRERDVRLVCGGASVESTLRWEFEEGLTARVPLRCEPEKVLSLSRIPGRIPVLEGVEDWYVADGSRELRLYPRERPIRVEVRAAEGVNYVACEVQVAGAPATPAGEGLWVGKGAGDVAVGARCDGRPAWPQRVPLDEGSVTLDWAPVGPSVDLASVVPEAHRIVFFPTADPMLAIDEIAGFDGSFALPPLVAGSYRLWTGESADRLPPVHAMGSEGVLVVKPHSGRWVGTLILRQDVVNGRIPVRRIHALDEPLR